MRWTTMKYQKRSSWFRRKWNDIKQAEIRLHELRRAEIRWKNSEDVRWVEMRWRWDGMTQTAVTVGCSEQFPRDAAMRWDQMKGEIIQHSKKWACCHEAQKTCLSPIGTAFAQLYRPWSFQIWNFRPRLARVLLVHNMYCIFIICYIKILKHLHLDDFRCEDSHATYYPEFAMSSCVRGILTDSAGVGKPQDSVWWGVGKGTWQDWSQVKLSSLIWFSIPPSVLAQRMLR